MSGYEHKQTNVRSHTQHIVHEMAAVAHVTAVSSTGPNDGTSKFNMRAHPHRLALHTVSHKARDSSCGLSPRRTSSFAVSRAFANFSRRASFSALWGPTAVSMNSATHRRAVSLIPSVPAVLPVAIALNTSIFTVSMNLRTGVRRGACRRSVRGGRGRKSKRRLKNGTHSAS